MANFLATWVFSPKNFSFGLKNKGVVSILVKIETENSFLKNRPSLTYALYIIYIKSLLSNLSFLRRLLHSHVVSIGSRLASVDPFPTSFLLPNQVIVEATTSVLKTSVAFVDLSRTSTTPRWSYDMEISGETLPIIKGNRERFWIEIRI